MCAIYVMKIWK